MTHAVHFPLLAAAPIAVLAFAPPALAQAPGAAPPVADVVVTATRLPEPLSQVSGAKVIDRADIERRDLVFAGDALATVPGAALSRNGPFGGVSTLRLRGASSDKTLVLIDGVPVDDPSQPQGSFDFAGLDLADVERIEILPGPQAALWGSDAIGGVVSVVTREANGLRAAGELGAYHSRRLAAAAGVSTPSGAFGLSASSFDTDGISKADARDGAREADPFHTWTLGANARLSPVDGVKLEGRLRFNHAKTHYDSFGGPTGVIDGPDTAKVDQGSGFVRATVAGPLGFTHAVTFDASAIDRRYDGAFPFAAKGGRTDWRWLASQDPGRVVALALGLERASTHEDTGDGRRSAADNAGFAILRWAPLPSLSGTVSLRRDEPDGFKGKTTARASGSMALGGGVTLSASLGQGFKVPSLFETAYPCFECARPGANRALRPESAEGWDATLGWVDSDGGGEVTATVYGLRVRDRIDYVYPQGYVNIARSTSTGVEASARLNLGAGFAVRGSYAFTDATDSLTGAQLRVPRHSGTVGIDWTQGAWSAALLARAQTGAPDSYGHIGGFTVVEASGGYRVTRRVRLTLRVENLLDRHYQEAFGYGEPGRSAYAGVSVSY